MNSLTAGSYAPRSPDLSALYSFEPQPHPDLSALPSHSYQNLQSFTLPQSEAFQSPIKQQHQQQQDFYTSTFSSPQPLVQKQTQFPAQQSPLRLPQQRNRRKPSNDQAYPEMEPSPPLATPNPPRNNSKVQRTPTSLKQESGKPAPGDVEGIEVKTKFPVARIKRIVQADEDVGKVAQVTPVVVSKALELFMISLALKSATEARARSSKRVTSSHLKIAVLKDDQFDFLTEVVGKIPDAPAPSGGQKERGQRKRESNGGGDDGEDEDDEVQEEQEKPKRRRKSTKAEGEGVTRRRRKEKEDT